MDGWSNHLEFSLKGGVNRRHKKERGRKDSPANRVLMESYV